MLDFCEKFHNEMYNIENCSVFSWIKLHCKRIIKFYTKVHFEWTLSADENFITIKLPK